MQYERIRPDKPDNWTSAPGQEDSVEFKKEDASIEETILKLEKRLRALEARVNSNPILHFADGTEKRSSGPKHYLLDLLADRSRNDLSPKDAENWELILRCKWAEEPGGGRLVELIQSVHEPADAEER